MKKYISKLKSRILEIGTFIKTYLGLNLFEDYKKIKVEKGNKLILLDLPTHGNLGDHAIGVSEYDFIKRKYPNEHIYRFSFNQCRFCLNYLTKYITDNDKIYLPGGGFLGDLWKNENEVILNILKSFKKNRIIIFPQTIYFNKKNKNELEALKNAINAHEKLTVCVRERKSYDFMKSLINCAVLLVPDIALEYKFKNKAIKKNGKILLCFRNDKEQIFDHQNVSNNLNKEHIEFDYSSTISNHDIKVKNARKEVDAKIKEFASYSLVICDRLHAMIFSYLGGTSCIAFDNLSKKISGVYEWIKDTDGIVCVTNNQIKMDEVKRLLNVHTNPIDLSKEFSELYKII